MKDMVSKSHAKRRQDIKTKLMAAVAMLLVSSIMMVSTTYAWFTLSTAPEVTGIQTSVGANGNLEMALLPMVPGSDDDYGITSSVNDSNLDPTLKNVTWGNLVDLSNSAFYGLDQINLYPAKLNVVEGTDGAEIGTGMLSTPTYGADGRIDKLEANTVTSAYDRIGSFANGEVTLEADEDPVDLGKAYGVRAVGTASGMTDRQLALRNAKSAASTATNKAKFDAKNSLNANGQILGNLVIKKATGGDTAEYTYDEVSAILRITEDLLSTNSTGILQSIEKAYINYMIAFAAGNADLDDVAFNAFKGWVAGKTPSEVVAELGSGVEIDGTNVTLSLPSEVTAPVAELEATKGAVEGAQNTLRNLLTGKEQSDTFDWNDFSAALTQLADVNAITVNGYTVDNVKDNLGEIAGAAINGGGITVTMKTGGGVYADIADHCGNYTAQITLKDVSYGTINVGDVTANMSAETTLRSSYLKIMEEAANGYAAPSVSDAGNPITDMYGYIIDLAFRTNAAVSDLLLQTEAVDRIYADNEDETLETMGGGSTMTFTAENGFAAETMAGLMGNIRIVFFDTMSNKIFAYAKLDMEDYTVEGGNTITVPIKLYGEGGFIEDDAIITPLTQNTAQAVSVLVYLDGESIQNKDVAATGTQSMTGTMNLQFASSANLEPMVYTPLTEQGEDEDEVVTPDTPAATEYDVTVPIGVTGNAKATAGQNYTFTVAEGSTVSVVIADNDDFTLAEGTTSEGVTTYTIPAEEVTGAITITYTAPAAGT